MSNNNIKSIFVLSACLLAVVCFSSCKQEIEKKVVSRYADNRPKQVLEYVENEKGEKVVRKEILYYPGERKYMEKKFDSEGRPDGIWISWYENGNRNSQGTYVNGQWNGIYRVWHENGKLRYVGEYSNGERVGIWRYYDSTGVLVKTEQLNDN